mmetsp:Transcript_25973/g.88756  ORF Transcript_25973/g.88756 Transcript_25973/m.88756 type:complete len:218 (+) Transcript_25973:28-681(+)
MGEHQDHSLDPNYEALVPQQQHEAAAAAGACVGGARVSRWTRARRSKAGRCDVRSDIQGSTLTCHRRTIRSLFGFNCECLWEGHHHRARNGHFFPGRGAAPQSPPDDASSPAFPDTRLIARRWSMRPTSSMSPGRFSARMMSSASAAMPISSSWRSISSSWALISLRSKAAGIVRPVPSQLTQTCLPSALAASAPSQVWHLLPSARRPVPMQVAHLR